MANETSLPSEPEDEIGRRRLAILAMVREQGFVTIDALARRFGLSAQTLRRDIVRLDRDGLLQRFHGGAGMPGGHVRLGYTQKRALAPDAKERIGRAAADLVPDGSAVFLDVGTTVEAVARALRERRRGLRVFTSSLPAATILSAGSEAEVFVLGGTVRGQDGSLVGEATTAAIAAFRFDHAVIGFSGCEPDGTLMDFDLHKVWVKQAAIRRARRVVAVGTADKFQRSALVAVAGLDALTDLVTEAPLPPPIAELAAAAGVELVIAG